MYCFYSTLEKHIKKYHQPGTDLKYVKMTSLSRPVEDMDSPCFSNEHETVNALELNARTSMEHKNSTAPSLINLNLLTDFAAGVFDISTYKELAANAKLSLSKVH